jgi:hypothetical protein
MVKLYYRTTDRKTGKQTWNPIPGLDIHKKGDIIIVELWRWEESEIGTNSLGVLYTKRAREN